jgi:hypothetical protein
MPRRARPSSLGVSRARAALCVFGCLGSSLVGLVGCGGAAARPRTPPLPAWVAPIATDGAASIRDVALAADGRVIAAVGHRGPLTIGGRRIEGPVDREAASVVVLDRGGTTVAVTTADARPGPVAATADGAIAAVAVDHGGALRVGGRDVAVRGEPAAAIADLGANGAARWALGLGATEWVIVGDLAALPGGDIAVVGQFAGVLRIGDAVVTSAGNGDGFALRVDGAGSVRWLVRVGGRGSDALTGVAAAGDGVAIAGSFTGPADLRGHALEALEAKSTATDGLVGRLDAAGAPIWVHRLGTRADDTVAGVAVTAGGAVAIAATARGACRIESTGGEVMAGGLADSAGHGPADALVVVWDAEGALRGSALLGGSDYDGARAIAAAGDQLVVGGWFSGAMALPGDALTAAGGDDGFLALVDDRARVVRALHATGDGRDEVATVAATAAGWVLGLAHTAAARLVGAPGDGLPAPTDPLGGAALVTGGL